MILVNESIKLSRSLLCIITYAIAASDNDASDFRSSKLALTG